MVSGREGKGEEKGGEAVGKLYSREDDNVKGRDASWDVTAGDVGPTPRRLSASSTRIPYKQRQTPDFIGVPVGTRASYYNPKRGELGVNMLFKDKNDLISSVKDYSVRVSKREYRVVDSTRILWKVQCKKDSSAARCRWGLRASFKEKTGYWKITRYDGPHTCISTNVGIDHYNLNSNMVAQTLLGIVRCDPSYEIKYIMESVKDKYEYQISYTKAWRSLKCAVEIVYGTWESFVQLLPKYMRALCKYNPETVVKWKHIRSNNESIKTLNYVFWAFRPSIDGFRHCRNIISVDGTHLYTKYKHKMLIAVTLDAKNQVLPLAFAIVDEETSDSWKWFLENVGQYVVCGESGVCLISDRDKCIVRAAEDLHYFKPPHGVHRFYLRHECSNFNARFKDVHLKDLCWEAGKQHQICKFDATMEAIMNKNILAHRYLAGISKEK
ncbi:uncharacterized protein [Henckelia pumila]|uniref:uncharacterized protein n=1 Tax=Henckelia pumila TaxID=405737 RepID=UPI003C6E0431